MEEKLYSEPTAEQQAEAAQYGMKYRRVIVGCTVVYWQLVKTSKGCSACKGN